MSPGERARRGALGALLAVHVAVSTFGVVPGYLSIDEAVYHWTTRDLVETGSLGLRTGYEELASPELTNTHTSIHGGRVVSSYPYLFPAIAAPFFALLGYRGLFVVNALAFVGVALLVHALARRIFRDPILALDATLEQRILGLDRGEAGVRLQQRRRPGHLPAGVVRQPDALCTCAWDYSQAAWPHIVGLLSTVGAMLLAAVSLQATTRRAALLAALGAGLVAGAAPGVRIDAFLTLPCVVLALLFARPARVREAGLAIAGAIPGLAALALTNLAKFGSPNPLSYGNLFGDVMLELYAWYGAVLAVGLAAAWALTRERALPFVAAHRTALAVGAAAAAAILLALPQVRRIAGWAYGLVVDLRALDGDRLAPWVPRIEGGGIVYVGSLKHALLQNLPYLPILAALAPRRGRPAADGGWLAFLAVVPAATIAENVLWGYDGGLSLNLRLAIPALPFLAILAAYAAHDLARRWGGGPGIATWALGGALAAAAWLALPRGLDEPPTRLVIPLLVIPLVLAGALLALLVAGERLSAGRVRASARRGAWTALVVAVCWAGFLALLRDYPLHWIRREESWAAGSAALRQVPPGSLFFMSDFPDPFMRLLEADRVAIAFPFEDRLEDFPRLLRVGLASGRPVYGGFRPGQWSALGASELRGLAIEPVQSFPDDLVIARIRVRSQAGP